MAPETKAKAALVMLIAKDHWLMLGTIVTSVHWIFLALHPQLATYHFLAPLWLVGHISRSDRVVPGIAIMLRALNVSFLGEDV